MRIDRFHVQKIALDALQKIRIKHRWEALDNDAIEYARNKSSKYSPKLLQNGDMLKQLLAKRRYLFYLSSSKWTENKSKRSGILFEKILNKKKKHTDYAKIHLGYLIIQKTKLQH